MAAITQVGVELIGKFDTISGAFSPAELTDDPNSFPDPCEQGGDNCGGQSEARAAY